jgi:uncharacterized protein
MKGVGKLEQHIQKTEQFVRNTTIEDASGHDWFHMDRVRKNALYICKREKTGDPFIIEMASLLHDIPDEKFNDTSGSGDKRLSLFLEGLALDKSVKEHIISIIYTISFKGGNSTNLSSIEAQIVQDADRLDAIGAIGIARAFAYGGKKGQPIYDPSISVREKMTLQEYREGRSSTLHHFYEKLLRLKDGLNTNTARQMAEKRHTFMEMFLKEFYDDWNGTYENNFN